MAFDFKNWNELLAEDQLSVIAKLTNHLKTNTSVTVLFTKLNGDIRTLNCTLMDAAKISTESSETASTPGSSLSVWDIDNKAWRSFRFDRVISIS